MITTGTPVEIRAARSIRSSTSLRTRCSLFADVLLTSEAKPSFNGHWTLDPEASDDAGARMKEAMGDGQGHGGLMGGPPSGGGGPMGGGGGPSGGRPMGGPGGPGMGGFGAPPSQEEMETMKQAMDEALHASQDLLIGQDGVSFEIVHDGDRVVRLYADGRKNKGSTGIDKKTKWDGGKLVTESKVSASFGATVRITETWAMAKVPAPPSSADTLPAPAEGAIRLGITTRLEGGPFEKPVLIHRIYTRSPLP